MNIFRIAVAAGWMVLATVGQAADPTPSRIPILFDTDIGSDIDDAFALGLILASPEMDLRSVTTVSGDTHNRALMVCRFLTHIGRKEVPVAAGIGKQPEQEIVGWQRQYSGHAAVVWNRTTKPLKEGAVELMYQKLKADPGKITILAVGPLTNVAQLLNEHPDTKPWIKRIVIMGGCVRTSGPGKPAISEWNIKLDPKAAQTVFTSGIPLVVAPLDATYDLKLAAADRQKMWDARKQINYQIQNLYQLWDAETPILYDVLAATLCLTEKFCTMEDLQLTVGDKGMTLVGKDKPNARVATAVKRDDFLKWYVERMVNAPGPRQEKQRPINPSKLVDRGGRPTLVQVTETCETDIEKRWWMSGKLTTQNVPPDRKRVCRGVLTQDFDDRQGDTKAMFTAVIFNPVPGPPVGKKPRIAFRYWLKGTDQLRVQIYSLSNGYHRCLTVTGLPQERWEYGCVDMTDSRKPDGTGGPLGDTDRIDDIQFYADPAAELFITDIVLYEAAPAEEKRPFPKKIVFTGWFDTGRQGKDWPGSFEIVEKKPLPWKCAKSVPNAEQGLPWIRLHMRGERPVGDATQLYFRYKLTGADSLKVLLMNRTQKESHAVELKNLKTSEWAEATADFSGRLRKGDRVDELQFLLPKGAELLLDDVLLYEPSP